MDNLLHKCEREGCSNLVKSKERRFCSCSCSQIESSKKYKHTEEYKSKLRESNFRRKLRDGYINSPEARRKGSISRKGREVSEVTRQKIRSTLKGSGEREGTASKFWEGKSLLEDHRSKISNTLKEGYKNGTIKSVRKGVKVSKESIEKRKATMRQRVQEGVIYSCSRSKPEICFGKRIEEVFNVKLTNSFFIRNYSYDFKYGIFLFELDGTYWHSLEGSIKNDEIKESLTQDYKYFLIRFNLDYMYQVDDLIRDNYEALSIIFSDRYAILKDNTIRSSEIINEELHKVVSLNCKKSVSYLNTL